MRAEENPVAAEKPKRKTTSGRADENGLTLTEQVLAEIRRGGSNRAIAARVGCHAAYVSTVAQRHGLSRSLARPEAEVATSVRHMVGMDGPTFRAIRDHAEAAAVPVDVVISRLLAVAVICKDLDTHFPIEGDS